MYKMPQSIKQNATIWWRGSIRPPLGLVRLPKKLEHRRA